MTPISLSLILLAGILLIALPRPFAVIPLIISITLIPMGSILYIGPATFTTPRIIVIFGIIRIIIRGEFHFTSYNKTDIMVILWSIAMIITGALQPKVDTGILFRLGETYEALGMYYICRFIIKTEKDFQMVIRTCAIVFCILAVTMIYERMRLFNLFSLLGGVRAHPGIRDGKVRCQGSFAISILAGTVAATTSAWFITLWEKVSCRKTACIGIIAAIIIVLLSASSGPVMSLFFILFGTAAWPLRNNMKAVRISIIITIVILHFIVMDDPVWFIIARIDITGSSTGWHRAELIDSAIRHLGEWWLIGTTYTRHWMPTGVSWSLNHTDITNQYLKNGVWGGVITMFLFIFMISSSFESLGNTFKKVGDERKIKQFQLWMLGVSLFSHTITFISIRYFDQSIFYFYLLLALIGCATTEHQKCLQKEAKL